MGKLSRPKQVSVCVESLHIYRRSGWSYCLQRVLQIIIQMKRTIPSNEFQYMQCIDWGSASGQQSPFQDDPNQNQDQNQPSPLKRPSHKNKYIRKLKQALLDEAPHRDKSDNEIPEADPSLEVDKKIKNKLAAKESRDRKKMYIQILQKQTEALENQLTKTNEQLENCRAEILKTSFTLSQHIDGSLTKKNIHAFKKLKKLVAEPEAEEQDNEINLAIDSLCYRFAAMGKERQNSINDGYQQVIKIGIPIVERYIMWAARNQTHIFEPTPDNFISNPEAESWFRDMRTLVDTLPERESLKLLAFKASISEMEEKVRKVLGKLSRTKKKMKERCQNLDNALVEVRQIMTARQMAHFLLFEQNYRYWEDIRYHERIWLDEVQQEEISQPRKHFKLNQH